jgi:pilus assembly protein CpaB
MRQRVLTILLLAMTVSAGGTYIVYRMIRGRLVSGPPVAVSSIFVAARNLAAGTMLRENDLSPGRWAGTPLKGMIVDKQSAIGRGVTSSIYEGEPILAYRLAQPGAGAGLAAIIPSGMRACAVKVNDVVGVAGFVLPGMRVDVLISGNPPNGVAAAGPKVRTLLQNIEVLSAGQNIQKDAEGKPAQVQVVNLLVTPEQAEILSLASNETRIQLVLRNPLDTQMASVPGTVMANLFSDSGRPPVTAKKQQSATRLKPGPPPVAAPAVRPAPEVFLVEVLNGSHRTEVKFAPSPEARP